MGQSKPRNANIAFYSPGLIVLLVAFVVRLITLPLAAHLPTHGDETTYMAMAEAFLGHAKLTFPAMGYPNGEMDLLLWWPPLWGLFLVPAALANDSVLVGRMISVTVSALTALPIYFIAHEKFGRTTALSAGLIFAVMPEFVLFSQYLWSENLYCLLVLTAIWQTYRRGAWTSGGIWGLAVLTRVSGLAWILVAGAWSYWVLGRSWRRCAAWLVACCALIVSYSTYNSIRAGYPVLVADTAGYSLYYGNNYWMEPGAPETMYAHRQPMQATLSSARSHREFSAMARRLGLAFIRKYPVKFAFRGFRKLCWTWGPYTYPAMRVRLGEYACLRSHRRRLAAMATLGITHLALVVALFWGIWVCRRDDYTKLVLGLVLVTSAGCFVLVGLSRYAYPLMILGTPIEGAVIARALRRLGGVNPSDWID